MTTIVFANYLLDTLLDVVGARPPAAALAGACIALAAIGYLQLRVFSRPGADLGSRSSHAALAVMALLVYAPLLFLPGVWDGMHGFLAGAALLVLPNFIRWLAYAAVALSSGLMHAMTADHLSVQAYYVVASLVSGLVVYGLSRLPSLVRRLDAVRSELAVLAVQQERLRFADDVNAQIGKSLREIRRRAARVHDVAAIDPAEAKHVLSAVIDTSRQATSSVRAVASRYRELPTLGPSPAAYDAGTETRFPDEGNAVRNVSALFTVVVLGYGVMSLTQVAFDYSRIGAQGMLIATFATAVELAIVLRVVSAPRRQLRRPQVLLVLAGVAACTYGPVWLLGNPFIAVPGFLAGAAALRLSSRLVGWTTFALVIAGQWLIWTLCGFTGAWVVYGLVAATNHGLVLYALTRLRSMTLDLHDAREELATSAVLRERIRFARDLHDLLGFGLSAITLKSELAKRLIDSNPQRARDEMTEVSEIARLALVETETVTLSHPELSLRAALRSAQALLEAAGVELRVAVAVTRPLPREVDAVLALVVREAVTNVLRHSQASHCLMAVTDQGHEVTMEVVNDGVDASRVVTPDGSGTDNLTSRVETLGGDFESGPFPDGTYRLCAHLPIPAGHPAY